MRRIKHAPPKCGDCALRARQVEDGDDEDVRDATVLAVDWGNRVFCEGCYHDYKEARCA